MPPAPAVQSLQDLVTQYTNATAPQSQQIDTEIAQNDQSGQTQQAGIDAAKTAAFGDIANRANARGMTFSGFTPNAEAGYIGATYLPALAKLQGTIAATRNTLLGQKATLASNANINAIAEQKSQQQALDAYNNAQAAAAAKQAQEDATNRTRLEAAEIAANGRASAAAARGPSASQLKAQDFQATVQNLSGVRGKDGYVNPVDYNRALSDWVNAGHSAAEFKQNFSNFVNPNQKAHANWAQYQGY